MEEPGYLASCLDMDTIRIFFDYNDLGVKEIIFSKPLQANVPIF